MLRQLSTLGSVSLTMNTASNGQINLAVFSEGKPTFAMTFEASNVHLAEQELEQFCTTQAQPKSDVSITNVASDNSNAAPQKAKPKETAPKSENNTETAAPETTTSTAATVTTATAVTSKETSNTVEDDILSQFGL